MKPGASTLPPASIVRVAGPDARPTAVIRPSRTPTAPVTAGAPVPSMIRALVMRRSSGRGDGCWAEISAEKPAAAMRAPMSGFTWRIIAGLRFQASDFRFRYRLRERPCRLACVVRDDDVGAGAADRRQRF